MDKSYACHCEVEPAKKLGHCLAPDSLVLSEENPILTRSSRYIRIGDNPWAGLHY